MCLCVGVAAWVAWCSCGDVFVGWLCAMIALPVFLPLGCGPCRSHMPSWRRKQPTRVAMKSYSLVHQLNRRPRSTSKNIWRSVDRCINAPSIMPALNYRWVMYIIVFVFSLGLYGRFTFLGVFVILLATMETYIAQNGRQWRGITIENIPLFKALISTQTGEWCLARKKTN